MNITGVKSGSKCLTVFPRKKRGFVVSDGNGGQIVTNQPNVNIPYLRTLIYDESGRPLISDIGEPLEDDPPHVDSLLAAGKCGLQWRYRGRSGYRQKLIWNGCNWEVVNDDINKELADYASIYDGRDECQTFPMVLINDGAGNYHIGYRQMQYRYPGEIIAFGGSNGQIPSDTLLCNGDSYDPLEYTALFAAIGYNWGNDGGNFRVPDLRGYFLRGRDGSTGIDPDSGSRVAKYSGGNVGDNIGSYQQDALQCHEHDIPINNGSSAGTGIAKDTTSFPLATAGDVPTSGILEGDCGAPKTSDETRPKNAYVNYVIFTGCKAA